MLRQAAQEVLARLIEADAEEPDTYFVIVYVNNQDPVVKHGSRFREQMSGFGLRELEGDGILLENSREGRGRLASFYLVSDAAEQLEDATAEAGQPTPLQAANIKIEKLEAGIHAASESRRRLAKRIGEAARLATALGVIVVYVLFVYASQQQSLGALAIGAAILVGVVFDLSGLSGRSITRAVRDRIEKSSLRWLDRHFDPEGERPPSSLV